MNIVRSWLFIFLLPGISSRCIHQHANSIANNNRVRNDIQILCRRRHLWVVWKIKMHEKQESKCQLAFKLSMVKWSMDNRFQLDYSSTSWVLIVLTHEETLHRVCQALKMWLKIGSVHTKKMERNWFLTSVFPDSGSASSLPSLQPGNWSASSPVGRVPCLKWIKVGHSPVIIEWSQPFDHLKFEHFSLKSFYTRFARALVLVLRSLRSCIASKLNSPFFRRVGGHQKDGPYLLSILRE